MVVVAGFDLGLRRVAGAALGSGLTTMSVEFPLTAHVPELASGVANAVSAWLPTMVTHCMVEAPILGSSGNAQTAINMAIVQGGLLAYLANEQLVVSQCASASWKLHVVGSGKASKGQVRAFLEQECPDMAARCVFPAVGRRKERWNEDLADAFCIALYGEMIWA